MGEIGKVPDFVGQAAVWVYLAVALAVLPVLVPAAVRVVEPDGRRRRLLVPFVVAGAVVGALFAARVITGPVSATIEGCCLSYDTGPGYHWALGALYVVVTCFPMLASSYRPLVAFGMVNLVVVALLAWLLAADLASLWCAWAAVTSVLMAAHLRRPRAADRRRVAAAARRS